ncbi:MAG: hypothetical protein ACJAVO_003000 [Parvibaculaceae bacterium]|jgi:hypothetical protein|nr:hypothetical protein [Parvibaculaceae bacterium]|tara:strand:- start:134 stop:655 length:522 start_codon:yes stop_codon:yes gene_type:complete
MIKELKMTAMAVGTLLVGAAVVPSSAFAVDGAAGGDQTVAADAALQAQIDAVLGDASLSDDEIATKIANIVSTAADPVAAAKLVIASSANLDASIQTAVGTGLGVAATTVGVQNPTAGAEIDTAVTTTGSANMKTAFSTTTGTTGSTTNPTSPPSVPVVTPVEPSNEVTGSPT